MVPPRAHHITPRAWAKWWLSFQVLEEMKTTGKINAYHIDKKK
jgi:hypothetical protein